MRSFLTALLCLVAIVGAAIAVPAFWVNEHVVDRDGFSETVAPLADNAKVQQLIADEITTQVGVAAPLVPSALVQPLADAYTRGSEFPKDFAEVMNQQHDWLFSEATPEDEGRVMSLDLTPMVNRVLSEQGLGAIQVEGPIEVPLSDSAQAGLEAGRYHQLGEQIGYIAFGVAIAAIVATLGALIFARRRGLVLLAVGFGVVIGGILTWLLGEWARRRAQDEVGGAEGSAREVADLMVDKVVDNMQNVGLIAVGAGVALAAIGLLISALLERRR
ncbi:hypothetical protein [Williamsia soli]|uniref:hypothetical protein n=1 Tax=Williamsia soli TaxID=364929 RepID=UPI001A9F07A0|nr:hypothetical protein [Williamsia soli]